MRRFHPPRPRRAQHIAVESYCKNMWDILKHPWRTCLGTRACQSRRQSRSCPVGARSAGQVGVGLLTDSTGSSHSGWVAPQSQSRRRLGGPNRPQGKGGPTRGPERRRRGPSPPPWVGTTRHRARAAGWRSGAAIGSSPVRGAVLPFGGDRCAGCGRDSCGWEGRSLICVETKCLYVLKIRSWASGQPSGGVRTLSRPPRPRLQCPVRPRRRAQCVWGARLVSCPHTRAMCGRRAGGSRGWPSQRWALSWWRHCQ